MILLVPCVIWSWFASQLLLDSHKGGSKLRDFLIVSPQLLESRGRLLLQGGDLNGSL